MLASPFVPTPMLRGRCSKRPRRKWAVSWRRFDKSYRASRAPERKQLPLRCSFILSAHFRLWVTVWVRQLTHILTHTIFSVFATKKHRKPKFSMLFGAGGVTRTPDLWLLVRMHTGDLLMIFRHLQRLLCNSILHNHALVDIYLVKENCTIKLLVHISVML